MSHRPFTTIASLLQAVSIVRNVMCSHMSRCMLFKWVFSPIHLYFMEFLHVF